MCANPVKIFALKTGLELTWKCDISILPASILSPLYNYAIFKLDYAYVDLILIRESVNHGNKDANSVNDIPSQLIKKCPCNYTIVLNQLISVYTDFCIHSFCTCRGI